MWKSFFFVYERWTHLDKFRFELRILTGKFIWFLCEAIVLTKNNNMKIIIYQNSEYHKNFIFFQQRLQQLHQKRNTLTTSHKMARRTRNLKPTKSTRKKNTENKKGEKERPKTKSIVKITRKSAKRNIFSMICNCSSVFCCFCSHVTSLYAFYCPWSYCCVDFVFKMILLSPNEEYLCLSTLYTLHQTLWGHRSIRKEKQKSKDTQILKWKQFRITKKWNGWKMKWIYWTILFFFLRSALIVEVVHWCPPNVKCKILYCMIQWMYNLQWK